MIKGVGLDVITIARIARAMAKYGDRFVARIYTDAERRYCESRGQAAQSFAARFAAKEATIKMLGGPRGVRWRDMEVIRGERGAPGLALHGVAARAAQTRGIKQLHVSMTHDGPLAVAVVIGES